VLLLGMPAICCVLRSSKLLLHHACCSRSVCCACCARCACLQIEWARLEKDKLFAEGATWERVLHTKQSEAGEHCWYCWDCWHYWEGVHSPVGGKEER
jgi:hypothetical protein